VTYSSRDARRDGFSIINLNKKLSRSAPYSTRGTSSFSNPYCHHLSGVAVFQVPPYNTAILLLLYLTATRCFSTGWDDDTPFGSPFHTTGKHKTAFLRVLFSSWALMHDALINHGLDCGAR
jgi:hypothetical protein